MSYIKLMRSLKDKSFYSRDSEKLHLWVHLLLTANWSDREEMLGGKPIICKAGQFTTGRKQLSKETGINESKIERLLTYFEKIEHQIEQQKTSTNRLISILHWDKYQAIEQQTEQQSNNDRTTSEQQVNTPKEGKEIKEVKEINISFVDFWNLYDKKVGDKEKLKKKWDSFTDETRVLIMNHIPKYKLSQPDKKYRKDPSTYFNNNSWGDEIIDRCKSSYNQQQTLPSDAELTYENYLNELHNIDDRLFGPARGAVVYPLREKYRVAIAKHEEEEEKRKRNY